MSRANAPRLARTNYIGVRRYFLTVCTFQRALTLDNADLVESLLTQFRQYLTRHRFANHAYAFMPDHLHLVVEGETPDSDCYELIRLWKSKTAYQFRRAAKGTLWHRSFYDRVLRDHDEMIAVARYVVTNPARAGLPLERYRYPFVGSDTTTIEKILRGELPRKEFSKFIV